MSIRQCSVLLHNRDRNPDKPGLQEYHLARRTNSHQPPKSAITMRPMLALNDPTNISRGFLAGLLHTLDLYQLDAMKLRRQISSHKQQLPVIAHEKMSLSSGMRHNVPQCSSSSSSASLEQAALTGWSPSLGKRTEQLSLLKSRWFGGKKTARGQRPARACGSLVSEQSAVHILMMYLGRGIKIATCSTKASDELRVSQLVCSGQTVCVYQGRPVPGETFGFMSLCHSGLPFSAMIHINSIRVARLSGCCEYQCHHQPRHSSFRVVDVKGGKPCSRCTVTGKYQKYWNHQPSAAVVGEANKELDSDDVPEAEETSRLTLVMSDYHLLRSETKNRKESEGSHIQPNRKFVNRGSSMSNKATQTIDLDTGVRVIKEENVMKILKKKQDQRLRRLAKTAVSSGESVCNVDEKHVERRETVWKIGSPSQDDDKGTCYKGASCNQERKVKNKFRTKIRQHITRKKVDSISEDLVDDMDKKITRQNVSEIQTREKKAIDLEGGAAITARSDAVGNVDEIRGKLAGALLVGTQKVWSEVELSNSSESEDWLGSEEEKCIKTKRKGVRNDDHHSFQLEQINSGGDGSFTDAVASPGTKDHEQTLNNGRETESDNGTVQPIAVQNTDCQPALNIEIHRDRNDDFSIASLKENTGLCLSLSSGKHSGDASSEDITGENNPKQKFETSNGSEVGDMEVWLETYPNPSSTTQVKFCDGKVVSMDPPHLATVPEEPLPSPQCTTELSTHTQPVISEDVDGNTEANLLQGTSVSQDKEEHESPVTPRHQRAATSLEKYVMDTVTVLRTCESVGQLVVRNTGLTDDLLEVLVTALVNNRRSMVEIINLNLNSLGPASAQTLLQLLTAKPSVTSLLLYGNGLGDEGIVTLMKGLIELLTMDKSPEYGDCDQQAQPQRRLQLKDLDIGANQLNQRGLKTVSDFLQLNPPLDYLGLSQNGDVDLKGWGELFNSLKHNSHISHLLLDEVDLGDEGAKQLAEALRVNTSLRRVDLDGNSIGDEGAWALMAAWSSTSARRLTDLSLDGNNLSDRVTHKIIRDSQHGCSEAIGITEPQPR